jgi:hypothetical protein
MNQRSGTHTYLRIPLVLMAVGNFVLVGRLLWPWQQAVFVPGNENPAFDLALILPVYAGFIWWIAGNHRARFNQALADGIYLGPLSGLLLVAQIVLQAQTDNGQVAAVSYFLWAGAGLLWAIAGARGAKAAGHGGMGMFAGGWSAVTGCLMASTFTLVRMMPEIANLGSANVTSSEALRQADALATSEAATAVVLRALTPVEGVLLLGVVAGAVLGLVCGVIATPKQG